MSRGVKTFLLSRWKTLPAVIRRVKYYASVCWRVRATLGQSCHVYFPKLETVSLPHRSPAHYCFLMWGSLGKSAYGRLTEEVSFSLGCVLGGPLQGINWGSEDDEYNYNNMAKLMLKPQMDKMAVVCLV